jgi:hypothetical protein
MVSSGMLRRVALVRTDVSEEPSASFIRMTRIGELGITLAATSNRRTLRRNTKSAVWGCGSQMISRIVRVWFLTSDTKRDSTPGSSVFRTDRSMQSARNCYEQIYTSTTVTGVKLL